MWQVLLLSILHAIIVNLTILFIFLSFFNRLVTINSMPVISKEQVTFNKI